MSQNPAFDKLIRLLRELFQLDQPDLDFGLYRIMHARADEISQFLGRDLLPQVKDFFSQYQTADKAELEKELQQAIEQANGLGADPETTPKVKELRQKIAEQGVDVTGLEQEVYDHLYKFFRRYYHEGDFLAKRVYKPGVYAIPYEGEEVKLHWANKDQYYIKTSEYLRDYAFTLKPDADDPMRVHFRLVDVAEGEHGNVKEAEGKNRVFILADEDFIAEEEGESGKELVIRFEYRAATLGDWSEDAKANATAAAKKKPPTQKELRGDAVRRVLAVQDESLKPWLAELARDHIKAGGEPADYSRLAAHLNRYTARNTFDYFIHKDLGGFLRRELDFYIKNEVMHLDDIESETAPRVEQYLSKIKVIRQIAGKIIDFLAQLENFQKKLWLKKKFVTETSYCIRIGCIPEDFYAEIAANEAQRQEWIELHGIDEIQADLTTVAYSEPLMVEFLNAHPTLMVDTRYFDEIFSQRLLEAMSDIDAKTDGFLFHSDNVHALSIMQKRYRGKIKTVYIDPPYNTGRDGFLYKDAYQHSSWCSMLNGGLSLARNLKTQDSLFFVSNDDNENHNLKNLLYENGYIFKSNLIWNTDGHTDNQFEIKVNHEYITLSQISKMADYGNVIDPNTRKGSNLWSNVAENSITKNGPANPFSKMTLPAGFPVKAKNGVIGKKLPDKQFWEELGDRKYYPRNLIKKYNISFPVKHNSASYSDYRLEDELIVSAGWANVNKLKAYIDNGCQPLREEDGILDYYLSEKGTIYYRKEKEASRNIVSVLRNFMTTEKMKYELEHMGVEFSYPKPKDLISYILRIGNSKINLDFFAGSGTTGHSVIDLNREDGGQRKFILIEVGDYFDTVLLPRLKKVTFAPEWKAGKPKRLATEEEGERGPRIMKVIRLESYEDALNNLEPGRSDTQSDLLTSQQAQGTDSLREQYLLRYWLDVETRGSQSLLNIGAFTDPTAYRLKVKRPGSEETREVNVDLLETFNWLIGLTVETIAAPLTVSAEFIRDDDPDLPKENPRRLLLDGRIRESEDGPWWFRTVTGTTPDGRKTLVIWRKLTGETEQDNLVLDEWFKKQGYSSKDSEFDLIYVNGDNNLENLRQPDDTWKVRLIEADFHRLMFEEAES